MDSDDDVKLEDEEEYYDEEAVIDFLGGEEPAAFKIEKEAVHT